jgi:hypothetical protein
VNLHVLDELLATFLGAILSFSALWCPYENHKTTGASINGKKKQLSLAALKIALRSERMLSPVKITTTLRANVDHHSRTALHSMTAFLQTKSPTLSPYTFTNIY